MNIYLDNAATTRIDPRVLQSMLPYYKKNFANASSIHFPGQQNDIVINQSKESIAKILKASVDDIFFTSTATEANNLIIKGVMRANSKKGKHLLISSIEHPCVSESARELLDEGFELDYINVDKNGLVDIDDLKKKLRKDTVLVSIMAVNNEIGSIQDLELLGKIIKNNNSLFHTDAVQAVPYLNLDVKKFNIDFLSLSAHKFYGPQGTAMAYMKKGIAVKALIVGGGQERGLRAGTYNMAGIVGFTKALELAYQERVEYIKHVKSLRDYFWNNLKNEVPDVFLNASLKRRTPNNLNVLFKGIEGEAILIDLSLKGVHVSTGSACSAQNLRASSVIQAIGLKDDDMNSNIRFTFGKYNKQEEIDYVLKSLKQTVARLRKFSPINQTNK